MNRIALRGVCKSFGPVQAVRDVTLAIETGAFVTLLGPSGSGKTTTMRMIAGLEQPSAGVVAIGDRVVSGEGVFVPTHRRNLGMVFQSYAIWPHKTVAQNVAFPLERRRVTRAEQTGQVTRMLDLVGLGAYRDRYPAQLSGGQQQRVSLARALVAGPEVILFDEPLSNLDAQLRDSMRTLIRGIQQQLGITAVWVTHDQEEAMVLSDLIYLMQGGRLVQGGPPEALYERPANLFAATFIGQANTLPVTGIDRAAGTVRAAGQALRVATIGADPLERVLVVRPHQLSFAAPGANVLPGRVRSAAYLGDRMRYHVALDGGGELALETAAGLTRRSPGDAAGVYLPPACCLVM